MALKHGNRSAKGGKRPGAGRKPSAATQLKRKLIAQKLPEAEYAFALYCEIMRDAKKGIRIRLSAASRVMQEVWGLPKQKIEQSGELTLHVSPEHVKQARTELAVWESQQQPQSNSERSSSG